MQGFIEVWSTSPNPAHISGYETLLHHHVCLGMDSSYGFNVLCVFAQFLHIFCWNFNKLRLPWSGEATAIAVHYVAHLQLPGALQMCSSTPCHCWRTCPAALPAVGSHTDPSRQHLLCPWASWLGFYRQNLVLHSQWWLLPTVKSNDQLESQKADGRILLAKDQCSATHERNKFLWRSMCRRLEDWKILNSNPRLPRCHAKQIARKELLCSCFLSVNGDVCKNVFPVLLYSTSHNEKQG